MSPDFWVQLLSSGNVMVAMIVAEGFTIIALARFIATLINKLIDVSTKTAEVLEKVSNDYRTKDH